MNTYDEQRLREEVVYLHSLWRQGPPRNPNPTPKPENPSAAALRTPANTRSFKKQNSTTKKKKKKFWKQRSVNNASESESVRDSGPEWPVNPTPSPPVTTGRPEVKPQTRPEPFSVQEQANLSAMQVQHKSLQSCREFFSERVEEESDEDKVDEELGEVDYLTENDRLVDGEVYKFLLQSFTNDDKLRGYYEKNYERGDFCCLVCAGIGEKVNKRYKNCFGLVQHSIAISKTKRKKAHRAFGQVICKVLGWDIDRLPVIVLKGEPLGKSLPNMGITQDEADEEDMTVVEDNEGSKSGNNCKVIEKQVVDVNQNDGELTICENSLKVDDVNKLLETADSKFLNMEADKEVAMDFQADDVSNCLEDLDSKQMNPEVDKDVAVDCQGSGPSLVTRTGWSCLKPVDENSLIASGWPTWKPQRPLVICLASAQERAQLSAVQFQQKVLETCREYFEKSIGSDSDESNDEDEDDLMDEDKPENSEEFKFFLKVFTENTELRSYYEKNNEGGEFCCLVCGGIGKKVWKRFKDCLGLLQHSTAILNTKKKRAHRAFGQIICKVLGWDIDCLPTIVLKGEPLGHYLAKLGVSQSQGSPNEDDTNKYHNNIHNGSLDMEGGRDGETDTSVSQEKNVNAN